jgi:hypothetical protein
VPAEECGRVLPGNREEFQSPLQYSCLAPSCVPFQMHLSNLWFFRPLRYASKHSQLEVARPVQEENQVGPLLTMPVCEPTVTAVSSKRTVFCVTVRRKCCTPNKLHPRRRRTILRTYSPRTRALHRTNSCRCWQQSGPLKVLARVVGVRYRTHLRLQYGCSKYGLNGLTDLHANDQLPLRSTCK